MWWRSSPSPSSPPLSHHWAEPQPESFDSFHVDVQTEFLRGVCHPANQTVSSADDGPLFRHYASAMTPVDFDKFYRRCVGHPDWLSVSADFYREGAHPPEMCLLADDVRGITAAIRTWDLPLCMTCHYANILCSIFRVGSWTVAHPLKTWRAQSLRAGRNRR